MALPAARAIRSYTCRPWARAGIAPIANADCLILIS